MAAVRAQVNRLLVVAAVLVAHPAVAVAERVRPGAGRRVARRAVLLCARACAVRFEVRGTATDRDAVLVANHASPLDIPALMVACPGARFVAASELFRIPLLASAMRALDTVPITRNDPALARRQVAALRPTGPLVVFAEGGIVGPGETRRFKSGAFVIAITSGVPVVPVAIDGTGRLLPPKRAFAVHSGTVTIDVLAPIDTADRALADRKALRDEVEAAVRGALVA